MLPIVSQLQFHPSILCSVMLGLGLHKLHFPDPLDCCIPFRFCQKVLQRRWKVGRGKQDSLLSLLANPTSVDLMSVNSSLQLLSESLELSSLHPSEVARADRWWTVSEVYAPSPCALLFRSSKVLATPTFPPCFLTPRNSGYLLQLGYPDCPLCLYHISFVEIPTVGSPDKTHAARGAS